MGDRYDKIRAVDAVVGKDPKSKRKEPPAEPKPKRFPVVVQKWEETERGWGCRPDGWTMHLTEEDRAAFVKEFWARQRKLLGEETPYEYTRESGSPYIMDVDEETYEKVRASKNGTWGEGNMPPAGKQGTTGFVSVR